MRTGSTATFPELVEGSSSGRCRSRSSPLTRTATIVLSSPNRSSPVVVSLTRWLSTFSPTTVIDMLDTPLRSLLKVWIGRIGRRPA
jgi:hypothetical protein